MKCDNCKFAVWNRTKTGRLHPDKGGFCSRLASFPLDLRLPAAFYWVSVAPRPSGGRIERGEELPNGCDFKMTGEVR